MDLSKKIVVRELKYVGFYAIIYITFIAVYLVVINQFGMEISIYAKYVRDEILFVSWILLSSETAFLLAKQAKDYMFIDIVISNGLRFWRIRKVRIFRC